MQIAVCSVINFKIIFLWFALGFLKIVVLFIFAYPVLLIFFLAGVSPQDPLYRKKKLVLERMKCPVSGEFVISPNVTGLPTTPPLFNFLRVFHMSSGKNTTISHRLLLFLEQILLSYFSSISKGFTG